MATNFDGGRIRKGLRNPRLAATYLTQRLGVQLSSRGLLGTHVFEREWDVLVLLDTCRVDALRHVADEYAFLGDIGRLCSVGASSPEWMAATFGRASRDELRNTAYLACNAYADLVFEAQGDGEAFAGPAPPTHFQRAGWDFPPASALGRLEHLWRYDSGKGGHNPPRYVTDRAIAVGREYDFDRLIVHYAQPHHPYVATAYDEDRELRDYEREPFAYLRAGGDRRRVIRAYLADLRYVLGEVKLLLANINADTVVISADHGEAFGEHSVYKHPIGSLHPKVRFVPWARTSARDSGAYASEFDPENTTERGVAEQLEALGYVK